jgi:hypothetical protein
VHNLLSADREAKPTLASKLDAIADAAAAITVAAHEEKFHCLDWVGWSYNGGTVTGKLTIAFGTGPTTVFEVNIVQAAVGFINFDPPLYTGTNNEQMVVTLAAGGTNVLGRLNIRYR